MPFMSIEHSLNTAAELIDKSNYLGALTLLLPVLDATSKKYYRSLPVGKRFKKYIDERKNLIFILNPNVIIICCGDFLVPYEGKHVTIGHFIYKLRCNLLHEADISELATINDTTSVGFTNKKFILSTHIIKAIFILLLTDPHNANIKIDFEVTFNRGGRAFLINEYIGKQNELYENMMDHIIAPSRPSL
jgi:hypothetical protein